MKHAVIRATAALVGLLFLLGPARAASQSPLTRTSPETLEGAQRAARQALSAFAQLVTPRNAVEMGFEKPEEVRSATIGSPLPEFLIRLDELRSYAPGSNPGRLLQATGLYLFPVLVGDQVRSSLTIQYEKGEYRAVAFGAPDFIRRASRARTGTSGAESRSRAAVVRVPALNVFFVAYEEAGKLLLAPLLDDPRFEFKAGEPIPAEKALERLLPAAKEHTGMPT